jgi:anti-sigma B factor antagonist
MEEFSISTGVHEGFQILVIRGELDELTAPELDTAIDGHRDGWPVVIDLSETEFMSSAGLHVLLRGRERLAIVCPPGNIRRLLEIVEAKHHVPVFSDLQTAIQSLTLSHIEPNGPASSSAPRSSGSRTQVWKRLQRR